MVMKGASFIIVADSWLKLLLHGLLLLIDALIMYSS